MFSSAYKYMLAIARHQNITKAAEELYITQPALTKYLNRLEKQLGVRLFDREANPIHPTAAGEEFLKQAALICDLEQSLLQKLRSPSQNLEGTLTIGITPEFSNFVFPYVLPDFIRSYPGVRIVIDEGHNSELLSKVAHRKADFSLMTSMPHDHTLLFETLMEDPIVLAMPASHPVAQTFDLSVNSPYTPYFLEPSCVKSEDFIVCSPELGIGLVTQEMFRRHQLNPHILLTLKHNETALRLVSSGIGMAFVPARTPTRIDLVHPLAYFSLETPTYTRHRGVLRLADDSLSEPARIFLTMLKEIVAATPTFKPPACQLLFRPSAQLKSAPMR